MGQPRGRLAIRPRSIKWAPTDANFCSNKNLVVRLAARYLPAVDIEFDPAKDRANRRKHGLSLADAARMDFDTALYLRDDRIDYGEERYQALGMIGERLHMLVFTMRGDALRAISLRKANPEEVQRRAKDS